MTTYIYYCNECGHKHEYIASQPPLECEDCQSDEIVIEWQARAYD